MAIYPYGHSRLVKKAENWTHDNDYRFTGKEQDSESKLHYFETRYLSESASGRFVSVDAAVMAVIFPSSANGNPNIILPKDLNPYAYASGNPVVLIDPDGEFGIKGAVIGGVIGGLIGGGTAFVSGALAGKSGAELRNEVIAATVSGVISGVVTGSGAGLIGGSLAQGAGEAIGKMAHNYLSGKSIGDGVVAAGTKGAALGVATGVMSKGISGVLTEGSMSKAYSQSSEIMDMAIGKSSIIKTTLLDQTENIVSNANTQKEFVDAATELFVSSSTEIALGQIEN